MRYPGGKSGDGVYQAIINHMPPHDVYIEPFAGGGSILRHKRPAAVNIAVERDPEAALRLARELLSTAEHVAIAGKPLERVLALAADPLVRNGGTAAFGVVTGDGVEFLRRYPFTGRELVYCDPPYVHATRTRRNYYRFEMTDDDHRALLDVLRAVPCAVMVSGYMSRLYREALDGWETFSFQTVNRAGRRTTEWVWSNFAEPMALHDYRYVGRDYRQRERIKKKVRRWVARLHRLPVIEARALLAAIAEVWPYLPSSVPAGVATPAESPKPAVRRDITA